MPERRGRARGWLIATALLALVPKRVRCMLAYAGLGIALGINGPETYGSLGDQTGHLAKWLVAPGVGLALTTVWLIGRSHRHGSNRHHHPKHSTPY